MSKRCLLTVVDSISATNNPLNLVVLYRQRMNMDSRQIVISCSDGSPENVPIPDAISVQYVGNNKSLLRFCLKSIIKDCQERRESLVCHLHGQKSALAFYIASMGLGLRRHTLFTIHSTYSSRDIKYKLSCIVCTLLAKKANCVSEWSFSEYPSFIKMLKGDNLFNISNGVDIDRVEGVLKNINEKGGNRNILVCIGRIIPIKNQEFLIRLLTNLENTKLVLIGVENNSYQMRQLAADLGVNDRVIFTGLIPRDEVYYESHKSAIYVSSSKIEGLPVSVLEAMALGLVPVLSNIEPHKEIAKMCGMDVCLPLEKEKWVERIMQLQNMNKESFDMLSQQSKDAVKKYYSLNSMNEQYTEVFKELTK